MTKDLAHRQLRRDTLAPSIEPRVFCPKCGGTDLRPSTRPNFLDWIAKAGLCDRTAAARAAIVSIASGIRDPSASGSGCNRCNQAFNGVGLRLGVNGNAETSHGFRSYGADGGYSDAVERFAPGNLDVVFYRGRTGESNPVGFGNRLAAIGNYGAVGSTTSTWAPIFASSAGQRRGPRRRGG